MARLSKSALVALVVNAIASDGWSVTLLTGAGTHPARFTMKREGVEHTVRLYIWNLSHGGKNRPDDEFRIQVTGVDRFEPEPSGRTLILGWGEDFGVFAGFDARHRFGQFGASPSIQIKIATLRAAGDAGAEVQDKGQGEHAIGLRPDKLGRYVQHLEKAHAGNLDPILAPDESQAADPLTSEIDRLTSNSVGSNFDVDGEDDLRTEIISGVDEVLAALETDEPDLPPRIGHNQPPEAVDEQPPLAPQIVEASSQIKSELGTSHPDIRRVGSAGAFLAWAGRLLQIAKEEGAKFLDKGKDLTREYAVRALWGAVVSTGRSIQGGDRGIAEAGGSQRSPVAAACLDLLACISRRLAVIGVVRISGAPWGCVQDDSRSPPAPVLREQTVVKCAHLRALLSAWCPNS